MRKNQAFFEDLRDILDRSFDTMRTDVFRPTVSELNALETQLVSEFSTDASHGVTGDQVADFVTILKSVHGTRIALEEQLTQLAEALRDQLGRKDPKSRGFTFGR